MNNTKTKLYVILASVLGGLIVLYVLSSNIIPKLLVTRSKAAVAGKVNLAGSYLIGGKIMCKPDGVDKCVVNAFVVDAEDRGITGRTVKLSGATGIVPPQATTDVTGKAKFEITSAVEGQFKITATVDGAPMTGKTVTVIFRN